VTGGVNRRRGTAEIDRPTPVAKGDARAPSPTSQRIGIIVRRSTNRLQMLLDIVGR
jgi:hypothetical protein